MTTSDILKALSNVQEPDLGKDLVTLNMIKDLQINDEAQLPCLEKRQHIKKVMFKSNLTYDANAAAANNKITHIDYVPPEHPKQIAFDTLLYKEPQLRKFIAKEI